MRIHPNNNFRPGDSVRVCGVDGTVVHVNGKGLMVMSPGWSNGFWFTYKKVELINTEDNIEIDAADLLALTGV